MSQAKDSVKVTLTYEVPTTYYNHPSWWADNEFDFDIQDISRDFGYLTSVDVIHQPKSFISKIKNWMGGYYG